MVCCALSISSKHFLLISNRIQNYSINIYKYFNAISLITADTILSGIIACSSSCGIWKINKNKLKVLKILRKEAEEIKVMKWVSKFNIFRERGIKRVVRNSVSECKYFTCLKEEEEIIKELCIWINKRRDQILSKKRHSTQPFKFTTTHARINSLDKFTEEKTAQWRQPIQQKCLRNISIITWINFS